MFNRRFVLALGLLVVLGAAGYAAWRYLQPPQLPAGFASGNGRLEATEFDVAAKFAGRLLEITVQEGDTVEKGQVLARMDAADLAAAQREAQAQLQRAQEGRHQALALVQQRESEYRLAQKTVQRTRAILAKGLIAKETADQHESALQTAAAGLESARTGVAVADASIQAARATLDRVSVGVDDAVLRAPVAGRVLYRLAEPGEVIGAGGKVLTLIDLTDVYLPFFLPTEMAGRVRLGADVRIVFDAMPERSIPAKVSFVAPRAQFTPKEVETRTEREKLMFRVKARIARELLLQHADLVKTGVPGVAYVRLDPHAYWPAWLPAETPIPAGGSD
jgi:HlyD family secretion protein